MPDRLEELVHKQRQLMEILLIPRINETTALNEIKYDDAIMRKTFEIVHALNAEVVEFMQELNWKSWKKTTKAINKDFIQLELVDALHFLLELMIIWGMDASKIYTLYKEKMDENIKRQESGY
jgi:dimeric dUTPase (all-alpha-NTP-PPase superfamily)